MKATSIITGDLATLSSPLTGALVEARASVMEAAGHLVAAIVGLRRRIVRHAMTDSECERTGLPYDSTEKAVYVMPLRGAPWWHFVIYWNRYPDESCIDLRGFGCSAEVWYVTAGA